MKKPIIYLFFILVLCSFAYAAPKPATIISSSGMDISYPILDYRINTTNNFTYFRWWVYNLTTGTLLTNTTSSCTFNLMDNTGKNILRSNISTGIQFSNLGLNECQNCFNFNISEKNFTYYGGYYYQIRCYDNTNTIGGHVSSYFIWIDKTEYDKLFLIEDFKKGQDGSIIALTLFLLLVNGILFYLSFKKRFKDELVDFIVRRCLLIISIFLLMWNTTIIATMVSNSNLGVTKELFMYMEIFGYVGYIGIIILFFTSLLQFMKAWKTKKQRKSDGEHYEQ